MIKAPMGLVLTLTVSALLHAAAWKWWRPLPPWCAALPPAEWWHGPAWWLAVLLLGCAALALFLVWLFSISDSDANVLNVAGWGSAASVPYTVAVLIFAALSGSPASVEKDGLPDSGATTGLSVAAPESTPLPRPGSPAVELKVSSVADAEAGLFRVRDHLRSTLAPAIARLNLDVDDIKVRLKSSGISGSADLKDNARGRVLAQELAEAIRYRNAVAMSIEVHKNAEFELDSLLRRLKRAELVASAGLPEGDFLRMNATLRLLDGQLAERAGQPKELSCTELDELIDKELGLQAADVPSAPSTVAATHR